MLLLSQAVEAREVSGHLGQLLIIGREILTMILPLLIVAVIDIQSPCLFLGRGCLYFIV